MEDLKDNDKTVRSDQSLKTKVAPEENADYADAMKDMEELASVFAETSSYAAGYVTSTLAEKTTLVTDEAPKPSDASSSDKSILTAEGVVVTTSPTTEVESVQDISRIPRNVEKETELITMNGLLLVGLAFAMLYVGTVVFAKDSLIFFAGIFVYMIVAPPGTYGQGKSKMASFTRELALAFGLTLAIFFVLKQVLHPDADQVELLIVVLATLGIKLVHFPYYTTKDDPD